MAEAKKVAKPIKIPKTTGACADRLFTLRAEKAVLTAQIAKIAEVEGAIEAHLIYSLPADDAEGVVGKLATVRIVSKVVPLAEDWPKLYGFIVLQAIKAAKCFKTTEQEKLATQLIVEHAPWDLIQRRVSGPAVKDRWTAGVAIPGISKFNKKDVTLTKR